MNNQKKNSSSQANESNSTRGNMKSDTSQTGKTASTGSHKQSDIKSGSGVNAANTDRTSRNS